MSEAIYTLLTWLAAAAGVGIVVIIILIITLRLIDRFYRRNK